MGKSIDSISNVYSSFTVRNSLLHICSTICIRYWLPVVSLLVEPVVNGSDHHAIELLAGLIPDSRPFVTEQAIHLSFSDEYPRVIVWIVETPLNRLAFGAFADMLTACDLKGCRCFFGEKRCGSSGTTSGRSGIDEC
jgi:hypothetical protein